MDHSVFRSREFPLLDDHHKPVTYLDWTGAALPPASLIEQHCRYLSTKLLGNPHSAHHPSKAAMDDMDRTRAAVLTYFKADPSEYDVVFTSGATGAILLLQHFMFEGGELLLSADNHNSVTGLREVARRAGAKVRYLPITEGLGLDKEVGEKMLGFPVSRGRKLFCFPAKSNYSGVHHSLGWIATAQMLGWSVLLDAAAYLANERLDLSLVHPDFVPVSFYKLFGYPTGLGCLIVRKAAYESLHKRWFAGGSILLVAGFVTVTVDESMRDTIANNFFPPASLDEFERWTRVNVDTSDPAFIPHNLQVEALEILPEPINQAKEP